MATIDSASAAPRMPQAQRVTKQEAVAPTTAPQVEQLEMTAHEQMHMIQDDLSAVLSQFRRKTDFDKRGENISGQFERVLEDDAVKKLDKVVAMLRSGKSSPEDLLAFARSMFPDDSDLFLILRELIKRRNLERSQLKTLEQAAQQVAEQADPQLLKAGINVALKAKMHGKRMPANPRALRSTYRQFLMTDGAGMAEYEHWIGQYGFGKRAQVLTFIEDALIYDIQALDPSCSRAEFGQLLGSVVKLKKLRSSEQIFIEQLLSQPFVARANLGEESLLQWWFDFIQRPFDFENVLSESLGNALLVFSYAEKSQMVQALLQAVRKIDSDLFYEPEAKDILITSLLEWADKAYSREKIEGRRRHSE